MKKAYSNIFMVAKACRTLKSGRQGTPYFRRYDREHGFKTGGLVEEKGVGGAAVERLQQRQVNLLRDYRPIEVCVYSSTEWYQSPLFETCM